MDTNIYIACLRQVVAFAPKVIIIACLRQGFCIHKRVINAPPTASHKGGGRGFAKDVYHNDGGKGGEYAYEAYEVK